MEYLSSKALLKDKEDINISKLKEKLKKLSKPVKELFASLPPSNDSQEVADLKKDLEIYLTFVDLICFNLDEIQQDMTALPTIDSLMAEMGIKKQTISKEKYDKQENTDRDSDTLDVLESEEKEKTQPTCSLRRVEELDPTTLPLSGKIAVRIDTFSSLHSFEQEQRNHEFLAAQSIELLMKLYEEKRFHLMGVVVHALLVHLHIAVEQKLRRKTTAKQAGKQEGLTHDLEKIIKEIKENLSNQEIAKFCEKWKIAQLEARYPIFYAGKKKEKSATLQQIQFWNQLAENPGSYSYPEIQGKILELLQAYSQVLSFEESNIYTEAQIHMYELIQQVKRGKETETQEELEVKQDSSLLEEGLRIPSAFMEQANALQEKIEDLQKKIGPSFLQSTSGMNFQEAYQYLKWMAQAEEMQRIYAKTEGFSSYEFWFLRISLYLDKLFDLLQFAYSDTPSSGTSPNHRHGNFAGSWEEADKPTEEELDLIRSLNLSITHHYISSSKPSEKAQKEVYPIFSALLERAKSASFSFQAQKTVTEEQRAALKEKLKQGFSLWGKTLQTVLYKIERDLEKREEEREKKVSRAFLVGKKKKKE